VSASVDLLHTALQDSEGCKGAERIAYGAACTRSLRIRGARGARGACIAHECVLRSRTQEVYCAWWRVDHGAAGMRQGEEARAQIRRRNARRGGLSWRSFIGTMYHLSSWRLGSGHGGCGGWGRAEEQLSKPRSASRASDQARGTPHRFARARGLRDSAMDRAAGACLRARARCAAGARLNTRARHGMRWGVVSYVWYDS